MTFIQLYGLFSFPFCRKTESYKPLDKLLSAASKDVEPSQGKRIEENSEISRKYLWTTVTSSQFFSIMSLLSIKKSTTKNR